MREANVADLKLHPLAHLIPDMRSNEWRDFYADVAMRGIKVPLEVLADGTVIDGRHRLRAAIELAMKRVPIVDPPLNGDTPEAYMLKAAVLRRHLTDDQRAMMAALWIEENKKQGKRTDLTSTPRGVEVAESAFAKKNPTHAEAMEVFKVSRHKAEKAAKVQDAAPALAQKVHQGEIALNNAYRQVKGAEERKKITSTVPPEGTYQVIVIDPPWPFTSRQNDPTHEIASPYEPMSIEKIKAFKIPAAEDSVLWLWVPNTFLHDAFHVLEAWGFTYHTTLTWAKNFVGLGDWLGGQTEHCLLATRGKYRIYRTNESTLLEAPRIKHSEKPDSFYELVERLCPGQKIDMCARHKREGWEAWGIEIAND